VRIGNFCLKSEKGTLEAKKHKAKKMLKYTLQLRIDTYDAL
jgi:hypothetical protein